jgi:hypothetical protein
MCTFQPMLRATPNVSISMRTKVEHSATAVKRGGVKRRVVHNSQSWGFCREREVNEPGSRRAATDDVDRPRLEGQNSIDVHVETTALERLPAL